MTEFMLESAVSSLNQALIHLGDYGRTSDAQHLRFVLIHLDGALELFLKRFLVDRNVFVIEKHGLTKGLLDCLGDVRRETEGLEVSDDLYLKDLVYMNEIVFLHNFRNEAQHMGNITKEENILVILPKVLASVKVYLKHFFDLQIDALDLYLTETTVVKHPLQLEFDEANNLYYSDKLEDAILKKYHVLEKTIREIWKMIFGPLPTPVSERGYIENQVIEDLISFESFTSRYQEREITQIPKMWKTVSDAIFLLSINDENYMPDTIDAWSTLNTLKSIFFNVLLALEMEKEKEPEE